MRAVSWSREWSVGGDPNDTTFFAIISLAATRDHIVVVDGGRRRLVALAQGSGRVQWRAGSPGSGPGELGHGVQVTALASGGFLMVDGSNRRLRRYSERGQLERDVPFSLGSSPLGACGDERQLLVTSLSQRREVVALDSAGAQVGAWTLPWPGEDAIPLLARQTRLFGDPASGRCLHSMTFGPHFAIWNGTRVEAIGEWVEPVPVAAVEVRAGGGQRFARGARVSAHDAAAVASHFVVLFRTEQRPRGRVLDVYDGRTGEYRMSIDPPVAADRMAIAGSRLVLAGEGEEGGVFVAAYAMRPSLAVLIERLTAEAATARRPGSGGAAGAGASGPTHAR